MSTRDGMGHDGEQDRLHDGLPEQIPAEAMDQPESFEGVPVEDLPFDGLEINLAKPESLSWSCHVIPAVVFGPTRLCLSIGDCSEEVVRVLALHGWLERLSGGGAFERPAGNDPDEQKIGRDGLWELKGDTMFTRASQPEQGDDEMNSTHSCRAGGSPITPWYATVQLRLDCLAVAATYDPVHGITDRSGGGRRNLRSRANPRTGDGGGVVGLPGLCWPEMGGNRIESRAGAAGGAPTGGRNGPVPVLGWLLANVTPEEPGCALACN